MAVGVEVRAVLCIAMSETCRRESLAVVVDDHRAEAYLVASVPVHVGDTEVMVAVAIPGIAPPVIVLPLPVERQLMSGRVNAEGLHVVLGVASASQEDVGLASVQEGSAEVVLRRAVSIAVAPVVGIAARQRIGHPQLSVGADGVWFAGGSLQVEQVLGTAVGIGPVGIIVTHGVAGVHVHIAYLGSGAVGMVNDHVVGTTHQHLGLAVAVPVIAHGIILLVGT